MNYQNLVSVLLVRSGMLKKSLPYDFRAEIDVFAVLH